ncbi:hypothetical protein ACU61A_10770 [Pseudonocardia sichuanensis]
MEQVRTAGLASEFRGLDQRRGALAATISTAISDWLWNPFAQEQRELLESRAESFEALARLLMGWPAAQWWTHTCDPERQVLLGSSTAAPSTVLIDRAITTTEPITFHQLATTSTFVDDELPAAQLADVDLTTRLPTPIGLWRLRPQAGAHVYEVQRLADWLTLCDDHPRVHPVPDRWRRAGASGRLGISPDWRAVAEDWDGVHFSMTGVLCASDAALTLGAYAVVPPTLETEVTFWFRHEFRDVALLDVWNGDLPD